MLKRGNFIFLRCINLVKTHANGWLFLSMQRQEDWAEFQDENRQQRTESLAGNPKPNWEWSRQIHLDDVWRHRDTPAVSWPVRTRWGGKNSFKGLLCPADVLRFFICINSLCWCVGGAPEVKVSAAFSMGCCDTNRELKGLKRSIKLVPLQHLINLTVSLILSGNWQLLSKVSLSYWLSFLCKKKE